jgi:hypothetical protein
MNLPRNIPKDLSDLLQRMATDFSVILQKNLVGIYLWGSLTYQAFEESCSDIDCVVVTQRDLNEHEFSALDNWFKNMGQCSHWVQRLDMRFIIENEFLDKTSRCCGFYPYTGKLVRHGSDGNPIIWANIGQSGITLLGKDAKLIAPRITDQCLNQALLLELTYLKQDLSANAGDRTDKAFVHNAYAILTACRILYSADHKTLVSKDHACAWAIDNVPSKWTPVIEAAKKNRLKSHGSTTPQMEQDARLVVEFVIGEVQRKLK